MLFNRSLRRFKNTCDHLQKCTLSRTVQSKNTYSITFFNFNINILQSPEFVIVNLTFQGFNEVIFQVIHFLFAKIEFHSNVV